MDEDGCDSSRIRFFWYVTKITLRWNVVQSWIVDIFGSMVYGEIKKNPMKDQDLNKDHLLPGQMVSADNYILRDPGRLYHTKGKSDKSDMFSGGCVFINHASGYVSIDHQVAINATETFKAKLTFEREAQSYGVVIKGYHTDNGIFNTS